MPSRNRAMSSGFSPIDTGNSTVSLINLVTYKVQNTTASKVVTDTANLR